MAYLKGYRPHVLSPAAMHEYQLDAALGFNGEIPIWTSLTVIIATTIASLMKSRRDATESLEIPPGERAAA